MNASASALTREGEVQSKIGKVRTFSRYARIVCSALFGFGLVGCVGILLIGVFSPLPAADTPYYFSTPQLRVWSLLSVALVASAGLAAVYQLYRLFGHLATGAIYTPENVRRVRNVGLLWLVSAVLGILIPVASAVLIRVGYFGASVPRPEALGFMSSSELMSSFISAGLILLASWIMDVGLYEKDHADALKREADLVI